MTMRKTFIKLLLVSLIFFLGLAGCVSDISVETKLTEQKLDETRIINGIEFEIQGDRLTEISSVADNFKFGVMADPHGYSENVGYFSAIFKEKGVKAIIILGDLAQHYRTKPHGLPDQEEIETCIEAAAKTGLPIFVIPGNHDFTYFYNKALKNISIKYSNVFDLSRIRTLDLKGVNFVSNPYGPYGPYGYDAGTFLKSETQIKKQVLSYFTSFQDNEIVFVLSHIPPRCQGKHGIDCNLSRSNEGTKSLSEFPGLYGHIHEARGGCDSDGNRIVEHTNSKSLRLNPGAVCPWRYNDGNRREGSEAIVDFNQEKGPSYQLISLWRKIY